MNRVLVTGATGYLGSRLVRELLPRCEVFGLAREPLHKEYIHDLSGQVKWLFYDGTPESMDMAVREARPDIVYHLAAYYTGSHDISQIPALLSSNITLGAYLLEAMTRNGSKRLIYTTTIMANYDGKDNCPLNLYAATKKAFSDLLTYYVEEGFLNVLTFVLSDTYGPGDHRPKILNLVRKAADAGKIIALSDGLQDYDVVYVDDVIKALIMAGDRLLNHTRGQEIYQIYSEEIYSLRTVVEHMLRLTGQQYLPAWGERQSTGRSMKKALRVYPPLPGWKAEVKLDEGLRKILAEDMQGKERNV